MRALAEVGASSGSFIELGKKGRPPYIWTPEGNYRAPGYIESANTLEGLKYSLPGAIHEARLFDRRARVPTSGEWHQIGRFLSRTDSRAARNMITREDETGTSTILDYGHGRIRGGKGGTRWYDGLVIQIPEINADGTDFTTDEKGIPRARHTWQMALPLKGTGSNHGFYFIGELPLEFDPFLDTIFGMKDARKILPENSSVNVTCPSYRQKPCELASVWRGGDSVGNPEFGLNAAVIGANPHTLTEIVSYRLVIE